MYIRILLPAGNFILPAIIHPYQLNAMKKLFTLFFLFILCACAQAQFRYFKGIMQGTQEVPANASAGSGVIVVKYTTASRQLELWGNYKDLSATITASHIHSPAATGSNGPVLINLNNSGNTTGTLNVTATLTAAQETDLIAGLMYVNVHNATFPGGEIRAQLSAATEGQTDFFTGRLQGAQEVPANASAGSGSVVAIIDQNTDSVWLTGNYTALSTTATAAHIHGPAAIGTNGPVFLNLNFSAANAGTLHVAAPIPPANQTNMLAGNTYVNIHNATFPGGEIRAQLSTTLPFRFYKGVMQGSQEVPANSSTGQGTIIVKYNNESKLLELTGDYQGLSTPITASHIHSPAAAGSNAAVLINLANTGGTSGVLTGTATLTPAQEADLQNSLMYVNVHNSNFPGGELRAQLTPNTGESALLATNLQGSQEVPANSSTATGNVTVLIDKAALKVYVTGSFTGLSTAATAGHIHTGAAGTNGPVTVGLSPTNATSGTITGNATITPVFMETLLSGGTYVNIHNATFPGGEIRGQLGAVNLPLKLVYFNGANRAGIAELVWETSQEVNVSRFEIEQQDATGNWIKKSTVAAIGGQTNTRYTTTDVPVTGAAGFVLYRLKIVDFDGHTTYSPVIKIDVKNGGMHLIIAANPVVNNTLSLVIAGANNMQKADVLITDYSGRILSRSSVAASQNIRLDVSRYAAGVYRLVVKINGTSLQENFIK